MRMAAVATAAGVAFGLGWLSRQPQVDAARREASTDGLTGLVNRSGLKQELRNRANQRKPYTLFMLDLNGFKPINDTYGHRAGDQLLVALAHQLQARLAGHLVTRLGGDEFMVIIDEPLTADAGMMMAHRIARAADGPFVISGSPEPVDLSAAVGFVTATPDVDYRVAMNLADQAMYLSKAQGSPVQITGTLRGTVDESPRSRVRDARSVRVAQNRYAA